MSPRERYTHAALAALVIGMISAPMPVRASELGRNGFSGNPLTNAGTVCTVCHAPGAVVPQVVITGPSEVDAGTTQAYSVFITGGPGSTAGVNVSVSDGVGELAPIDASLRTIGGELAHSAPLAFSSEQAVFNFTWTAPDYDTDVTIYAAGNSTNGNLDLGGDGVASTAWAVSVVNGVEPPPPPPPPAPEPEIALEAVASGLDQPVGLAHAGDERLFVIEQPGRIRVLSDDGMRDTPFLDIVERVKLGFSEEGMLGLAFHPNYADTGYFYVYYIWEPPSGKDRSRVSRFSVSADPNVANSASEQVLMEFEQPLSNHNGGDLAFGPDGLLYIASGDGGPAGGPDNFAQKTDTLLGKILRIDVDATAPALGPDCRLAGTLDYGIPASNAYVDGIGGEGCDEIYALGLRNPWQFSFDRGTGNIWIGDVGQNRIEEIDVVPAGADGGLNFGWSCFEGNAPFDQTGCDRAYLPPVYAYSHDDGSCSVTGGFVYRGGNLPALQGQYLFSDFCRTSIRILSGPLSEPSVREALPPGQVLASSFGEDVDGELYLTDIVSGTVYRIVDGEGAPPLDGDVDGDGDVDIDDVQRVLDARGSPADGPDDPRDLDGNGRISLRDALLTWRNCSLNRCARG